MLCALGQLVGGAMQITVVIVIVIVAVSARDERLIARVIVLWFRFYGHFPVSHFPDLPFSLCVIFRSCMTHGDTGE